MREILFRGKRAYSRGWVEGHLIVFPKSKIMKIMVWNAADLDFDAIEVAPETVGQFTGLTDQYGAKIWEGDIIRYMNDDEISIGVIRFGKYQDFNIGFNIEWMSPNAVDFFRRDIRFWTACREITVIGNIHDNPELLEVE